MLFCLSLLCVTSQVVASSQMQKVYHNIKIIDIAVSLKDGFHIIITKEFADQFLDQEDNFLTVYVLAIGITETNTTIPPMNQVLPGRSLSRKNTLKQGNLLPGKWYILCVEFENADFVKNRGTTSTDCQLARTLEKDDGKDQLQGTTISPVEIKSKSAEFSVQLAVEGPGRLTAFLEKGSRPSQVFMLDHPADVEVYFGGLNPGVDYGRFCVLHEPLTKAYSMLGRSIRIHNLNCHPNRVIPSQ